MKKIQAKAAHKIAIETTNATAKKWSINLGILKVKIRKETNYRNVSSKKENDHKLYISS